MDLMLLSLSIKVFEFKFGPNGPNATILEY